MTLRRALPEDRDLNAELSSRMDSGTVSESLKRIYDSVLTVVGNVMRKTENNSLTVQVPDRDAVTDDDSVNINVLGLKDNNTSLWCREIDRVFPCPVGLSLSYGRGMIESGRRIITATLCVPFTSFLPAPILLQPSVFSTSNTWSPEMHYIEEGGGGDMQLNYQSRIGGNEAHPVQGSRALPTIEDCEDLETWNTSSDLFRV